MSTKEFKKQLQSLRSTLVVDSTWKSHQRDLLVAKLSAQVSPAQLAHPFISVIKNSRIFSFKPAYGFFAVFALVVAGVVGSVNASQMSLPGDALYAIKLTSEKIQITLVRDESARADLHLQLAKKRVDDVARVASSNASSSDKKKIMAASLDEYKKNLASAQQVVKDKIDENPGAAVDLAKSVKDNSQ